MKPTLGIESSCDEMAAAVVSGREILASVVHAQTDVHAPYGGVVPELASRDHARCVSQVVGEAVRLEVERSMPASEGTLRPST